MAEIDRQDLHDAIGNLKSYIDDKFSAHEQVEKAMLEPIIDRVKTHSKILRGPNGDGGLVQDVRSLQDSGRWVKGIATTGFGAAFAKWIQEWMK